MKFSIVKFINVQKCHGYSILETSSHHDHKNEGFYSIIYLKFHSLIIVS